MEIAHCRSCGALVLWVKTPAGKWQILDAEPCPDGTIIVDADGVAHTIKADLFIPDAKGVRYMTHWATCPNSKSHKKGT